MINLEHEDLEHTLIIVTANYDPQDIAEMDLRLMLYLHHLSAYTRYRHVTPPQRPTPHFPCDGR